MKKCRIEGCNRPQAKSRSTCNPCDWAKQKEKPVADNVFGDPEWLKKPIRKNYDK